MYDEEEDSEVLSSLKKYSAKKRKTFSSVINSKDLSEEDLDDLFLSY